MAALTDYASLDATELAAMVRRREVSPAELAEAAIEQIERLDPRLNAVVEKTFDLARRQAAAPPGDGVFAGVPFLLKDSLVFCAGVPFHEGSRFYRGFVPDHDSALTTRLRRAGVTILGSTNTPELALMATTEPAAFGPTRNPWSPDRSAGGSSGGSAAAVAAGMVPMALGADGGGSIRVPASCCGLFGMKPTRGRTPLGPDIGESWHGFSVAHVLTRSVRDSAAMLDALAGPDPGAPYAAPPPARPFAESARAAPGRLRIAFTARAPNGAPVHPDCVVAIEDAAALLAALGHHVEEQALPVDATPLYEDYGLIVTAAVSTQVENAAALLGRRPRRRDLEAGTHLFTLLPRQYTAAELSMAIHRTQVAARAVARVFERYDAVLTPVLAQPPARLGELLPRGAEARAQELIAALRAGRVLRWMSALRVLAAQVFAYIPFTPLWNITGQPAMSVPLSWNAGGLPIGAQLAGRYGAEATLFALAAQLEEARPWRHRRPPAVEG